MGTRTKKASTPPVASAPAPAAHPVLVAVEHVSAARAALETQRHPHAKQSRALLKLVEIALRKSLLRSRRKVGALSEDGGGGAK